MGVTLTRRNQTKERCRTTLFVLPGSGGTAPSVARRISRKVIDAIRSLARERRDVYVGNFSLSPRSALQAEIVIFTFHKLWRPTLGTWRLARSRVWRQASLPAVSVEMSERQAQRPATRLCCGRDARGPRES